MCPRSRTAVGTQAANVVFEAAAKKRTYSESADSNWRTAWVGRCIFFVTLLPSSLEKWSLVRGPSGPVGAALRPRGVEGEAPDLQHGCALAYQVGQREFLTLETVSCKPVLRILAGRRRGLVLQPLRDGSRGQTEDCGERGPGRGRPGSLHAGGLKAVGPRPRLAGAQLDADARALAGSPFPSLASSPTRGRTSHGSLATARLVVQTYDGPPGHDHATSATTRPGWGARHRLRGGCGLGRWALGQRRRFPHFVSCFERTSRRHQMRPPPLRTSCSQAGAPAPASSGLSRALRALPVQPARPPPASGSLPGTRHRGRHPRRSVRGSAALCPHSSGLRFVHACVLRAVAGGGTLPPPPNSPRPPTNTR